MRYGTRRITLDTLSMLRWFFKSKKTAAPLSSGKAYLDSTSPGDESLDSPQLPGIQIALEHHQAGRLAEADAAYQEVLAFTPENFEALHLSGVVAFQLGHYEAAVERISRALACKPANAEANNNLGVAFRSLARHDEAIACFRNAIALSPGYVDACLNLGAALKAHGKLDEAAVHYEKVVALAPASVTGSLNLGVLREIQGNWSAAVDCYARVLTLDPDCFEAHFNLGNVLRHQGQLAKAIACYRNAVAYKPDSVEAYTNLANALKDNGRLDEAVGCYEKALALKPEFSIAHINLGHVYSGLGKLGAAAACYRQAKALSPNSPEAHFGLGNVLGAQDKIEDAIACYQSGLACQPDCPEAQFSLGQLMNAAGDMEGAVGCFEKAISLNADYAEARWALAMSRLPAIYESDTDLERARKGFSSELCKLERWFDSPRGHDGIKAVGVLQPFLLAYHEKNNRDLLQRYGGLCTRVMSNWSARQSISVRPTPNNDGVIRIGVVSQHFFNHSVWNAIVKGWFQQIDRKRFSIYAFYPGSKEDQETLFARANCTFFVEGHRELRQWVEAIIDCGIDVLIYPEIGMDPMTLRLASLRLAPVQVVAWGHPETSGLPTIDYYLSAQLLEPDSAQENYSETLVKLPNLGCYCTPLSVTAAVPEAGAMKFDAHIPLLLCPGVPFKYLPEHDWVLVEIARRLGRCTMVFFTHRLQGITEKLRSRLAKAFANSRLDFKQYVVFVPWQDSAGFYGLMKKADMFLDTIGFSGFNTAVQAAECGIPIVSREGRFMRGRLASGILKRMGLPELIAVTSEDYIALAVRLAHDHAYRQHIRERINISRQILFGDVAPIRALEDFLIEANTRH